MKIYEDFSSSPSGWNVTSTLEVADEGRFTYSEAWTDYTSASLYGGAAGSWRRGVNGIFFRAESVEGSMYFPWIAGEELFAIADGDGLHFPNSWTLRPPRTSAERVAPHPPPPSPQKEPESKSKPSPAPHLPWVDTSQANRPQKRLPVEQVIKPPIARFEPRTPSAGLTGLMRRWIDELPEEAFVNRLQRLCKENDAILLDANEFELWALRTDGQVIYIEHDSIAQRAEPETNADTAYEKIALAIRKYPELRELLPLDRRGNL
jgi:hypothetical protein